MNKILQEFDNYLKLKRLKSEPYLTRIKLFIEKNSIEKITQESVNDYIIKQNEKISASTVNNDIKALRHFMLFLDKKITLPKLYETKEKDIDITTPDYFEKEILYVVECIFQNPTKIKAWMSLLFYTGIRPSELITLKRKDIDLKNRVIKIDRIKTSSESQGKFPTKVTNLLKMYFITESEEINAFNITRAVINNTFRLMKPHFDNINIRPTLFRHTIATHLLSKGASMQFIQHMLGHKNIQSTLKYSKMSNKVYNDLYDEYVR